MKVHEISAPGSTFKAMKGSSAITVRNRSTTFPEMKLDWKTHPNNIGHFYFNGCFRCHDGQHVTPEGKVLTKDCDTCHTILSQQEGTMKVSSVPVVPFQHPVDLGDLTAVNCSDCHTGGVGP